MIHNALPLLAQAEEQSNTGWLVGVLVAAIALLLVLILVCRIQAFVSLLLVSMFVALTSGTMELTEIGDLLVKGMAGSLGLLATIVGLGAIFGQILEYSGGAQSLATGVHKTFGEKRAPMATILVGFLISIPVFFDVGLVILAPILVALAQKSGKSILSYGLPLAAAMAVTHACIPPTPGPILVGQNLGVDLGQMILWGAIVALPTALVAGIVGARMGDKLHVDVPDIFEAAPEQTGKVVPAWEVIALIVLPIVLILSSTLVKSDISKNVPSVTQLANDPAQQEALINNGSLPAVDATDSDRVKAAGKLRDTLIDQEMKTTASGFQKFIFFLGHPISALLLTTLITLILLGYLRGTDKNTLMDLSGKALGPAGIIILITGAGGVFKTVLVETKVGEAVAEVLKGGDMPLMLMAFVLTVIIRVAQGSATVAMIGGSAIMAPAVALAGLGDADRALMGIGIACGATMASHVNDSGFWVVKNYLGLSEKQCLQTWTPITCIISVVGFGLAWILSQFV